MNRRVLLQSGAAMLAWSAPVWPQPAGRFRIGCLWVGSEASVKSLEQAFVAGMRDHGYAAGRNLVLDMRYSNGDTARLPQLADELIALKPDVLVGIEASAAVFRSKSTTIPIVVTSSNDPVAAGLVQSLARPGTNVTGISNRGEELIAKHIEMLAEIVPKISRIALFKYAATPGEPTSQTMARYEAAARGTAAARGLSVIVAAARDSEGVRHAFAELAAAKPDAVLVAVSGTTYQLRREIASHARRLRLATISGLPAAWAEAGGLISYGPNYAQNFRYAASFVDRILRGASPAEMPIEQPAIFEFVVNLRTAQEIGVRIPRSILLRADRVIE